ncbi:DUF3048 domain-containing protein [Candidatus Saccharibacteria bacterium]|nr:DUF3048 domain-containing protein [Candidatus Saccharibacteria bacterium]
MIDDFMAPKGKPDSQVEENNEYINENEPEFTPPEDIDKSYSVSQFSKKEENNEDSDDYEPPIKKDFTPKDKKRRFRIKLPNWTKKQWAIAVLISILLLGSTVGLAWRFTHKPKPPEPVQEVVKVEEPPKPKEYISKLTGAKVSEADSQLPVTAIMIENSPDARPQAGLNDAGVVYEAVAEGGITRFLTLFQEAQPDYIGPIRSVRPYYLDWLVPFDAPVAHVGGSPEALAQIRNEGIKDLDYGFNSNYYHRISSRYAPHNVYTSRAEMLQLQNTKSWNTSNFTGWERKDEEKSPTISAKSIDFNISGFLYNPHFDYDPNTNAYLRSQAGKPHVDEKSGKQISPKVVIAIIIPKSIHPDGVHTVYGTSGSGKAFIFQDGIVTVGTWEKKDRKSEMVFKSTDGGSLKLNRGNTWISAVELEGSVTYAP